MKNKVWMPLVVLVVLLSLSWIANSQEAKKQHDFFHHQRRVGKRRRLGRVGGRG
jgi:hypothetical protein